MGRRAAGAVLPIELSILEAVVELDAEGTSAYGFSLAATISNEAARPLASHGTLYKALSRMTKAGLLVDEWEDPDDAQREGRPRRRNYQITALGQQVLDENRRTEPNLLAPVRLVHP